MQEDDGEFVFDVVFVYGLMGGLYRIWYIVENKSLIISGLVEKIDEDVGKVGISWFEDWFIEDFFDC